jgi:hypothetical protein
MRCAIGKNRQQKPEAAKARAVSASANPKRKVASVAGPSESHSRQRPTIKRLSQPLTGISRIRDEGKPARAAETRCWQSNGLTGSIDASHYRSRGAASHLKFNVLNVHSACTRCNRQLSGNAVEYRIHLIERIGLDRVAP